MSTSAPVDIAALITSTPGVQGGKPCLAGTRVRVQTIAVMAMDGLAPEQILEDLPQLDLARIHAALAYYYANKEQVEADLETERRLGEQLSVRYPRGWTHESDAP